MSSSNTGEGPTTSSTGPHGSNIPSQTTFSTSPVRVPFPFRLRAPDNVPNGTTSTTLISVAAPPPELCCNEDSEDGSVLHAADYIGTVAFQSMCTRYPWLMPDGSDDNILKPATTCVVWGLSSGGAVEPQFARIIDPPKCGGCKRLFRRSDEQGSGIFRHPGTGAWAHESYENFDCKSFAILSIASCPELWLGPTPPQTWDRITPLAWECETPGCSLGKDGTELMAYLGDRIGSGLERGRHHLRWTEYGFATCGLTHQPQDYRYVIEKFVKSIVQGEALSGV